MAIDPQTALYQIDALLQEIGMSPETTWNVALEMEFTTRSKSLIERLSPPGSIYIAEIDRLRGAGFTSILIGVVRALRKDYANGCMTTYRELVHADVFSDFLEMAAYLLQDENLKQPAAVIAGGVLEEHLRNLWDKHLAATASAPQPQKVDAVNAELAKGKVYGSKNEQKQITAWLGIRNSAAHAKYDEFDESHVRLMIDGLRGFISKYPA